MENPNNFEQPENKAEQREREIDGLISKLAEREGMDPNDVLSDIITFAPDEENDSANPAYIEQVAEMLGISEAELGAYAIKKAREF